MQSTSRFVQTENARIAFKVEGHGPPVLFIQGVGVAGCGWSPQIAGLKSDFQCATFDNRGVGASSPPSEALTIAGMANDACRVMDELGWESAHIVGHSVGGLVALQLGLEHRHRVRSLSLLCTFADGAKAAPLTWRMIWLGLRSQIGTRRMRRHGFVRLVMPPEAVRNEGCEKWAAEIGNVFGRDLGDQPRVAGAQLKAMRAFNVSSRLGVLAELPTLVVSGRFDPIATPDLGRQLASGIPNSHFVEFEDASHAAPIQFAERTNELLRGHLAAAESVRSVS